MYTYICDIHYVLGTSHETYIYIVCSDFMEYMWNIISWAI